MRCWYCRQPIHGDGWLRLTVQAQPGGKTVTPPFHPDCARTLMDKHPVTEEDLRRLDKEPPCP